jgi:hypothetical protein
MLFRARPQHALLQQEMAERRHSVVSSGAINSRRMEDHDDPDVA